MLKYIEKLVKKLKANEKGQGMVEYALIIAFVAAIAIVALNQGLGTAVSNAFGGASALVDSASNRASAWAAENETEGG